MIVKIIKNLENKMEKMQDSIKKDLNKLKNKHASSNMLSVSFIRPENHAVRM